MQQETIAAISTPIGEGGISIVRLSGPQAKEIADRVFRAQNQKVLTAQPGYTGLYGRVYQKDTDLDECVAYVYTTPKSYTGEDVVELCCHGSTYLAGQTLAAVIDAGARLAQPGEFTKRAFLNGKLSLTQAEAVMDLITSHNAQGARAALAARDGALYHRIDGILQPLLTIAGHIAAWIDYPEEEMEAVREDRLLEQLTTLQTELIEINNTYRTNLMLKNGIDTVIVGRPNVGKSTLMNLLAGYEKSIVTQIPGTTRDIIEDTIKLDDVILRLSDTAGLHETADPVEQIGVQRAWDKLERAQLVLAVFDRSEALTEADFTLIRRIRELPTVAVVNKSDLAQKINKQDILDNFKHIVEISAREADGVSRLQQEIKQVLELSHLDTSAAIVANERQRGCALRAQTALTEAIESLRAGVTLDAVGVLLDDTIGALLELTGRSVTEEVVNQVFSKFCVGK